MTLYQSKSAFRSPDSYIVLQKPTSSSPESVRFNNNSISILDTQGKIIKDVFTSDCKSFPINLSNDQIVERSIINNIDEFVYGGKNMSVFYIGSSNSGKQRLFDGSNGRANNSTPENSLISYFINYAIPMFKKKYQRLQIRMKMAVSIKEKLYDCLSENRYSIIKLEQNPWEGMSMPNACTVIIENGQDFSNQVKRGIKQKNKLVLEYKELYMSYLELDFIHESDGNQRNSIISKLRVFQVPGVEILGDSHSNARVKEAPSSIKSLLNFTALLQEYAKNEQFVPYSQNSVLTMLAKQVISCNSLISTFFTFRVDDVQGALATSKFIKPFNTLKQYPIVNESVTFGLIRKYRSQALKRNKPLVQNQKGFIQNEVMRLQTEEDYQRIMQKYAQLKHKYNQALKSKSQAQLELIKCEEEKIEIGKTLVEVQIENTKLLEKLQSKDYQNGKRLLNVENKLAEKEMSSQEMLQKLQQANQSLNQALEAKRDLEVQFIALKRNFLIVKKQLQKVKQDNQALSLDIINITNHNQRLKNQVMNSQNKGPNDYNTRKSIIHELQTEKQQQLKRQIKNQQQTITYLKSQVERYKKELVETQLNNNNFGNSRTGAMGSKGKDYERIQLQSENMQLANRLKLKQRKIDQIQQKIQFYEDQNQNLQNQVRRMKIKDHQQTQQYRKKLQDLVKNTNYQDVVKQLKNNFNKKDTENLDKINNAKRQVQQLKRTKAQHKRYIRELINLLQEYSPKGIEIPDIKKYLNMDLNQDGQGGDSEALRIKCRRLQEEVKRLKQGTLPNNGTMTTQQFRQSRVKQQYDHLKNTINNKGSNQIEKLKAQKNALVEENRRLTVLLKDGNKMDLNILKKQNQQLRKQLELTRNENMDKSSFSPSTTNNDQKIVFYEKHIKKIQKERSELLSRCVVAEEQVKNLLAKMGKGGK